MFVFVTLNLLLILPLFVMGGALAFLLYVSRTTTPSERDLVLADPSLPHRVARNSRLLGELVRLHSDHQEVTDLIRVAFPYECERFGAVFIDYVLETARKQAAAGGEGKGSAPVDLEG